MLDFKRVMGCNKDDVSPAVVVTTSQQFFESLRTHDDRLKLGHGWYDVLYSQASSRLNATVFRITPGAPVMCDFVKFLSETKPRRLIFVGTAGGIAEDVEIGDLVVPTAACRGEGASHYHALACYPGVASFSLFSELSPDLSETCKLIGVSIHIGISYTIDSLSAETQEMLSDLRGFDVLAIDMETSAFYVMASLCRIPGLALLVISDHPINSHRLDEKSDIGRSAKLISWADVFPKLVERLSSQR